jgi:hypothetical protein
MTLRRRRKFEGRVLSFELRTLSVELRDWSNFCVKPERGVKGARNWGNVSKPTQFKVAHFSALHTLLFSIHREVDPIS